MRHRGMSLIRGISKSSRRKGFHLGDQMLSLAFPLMCLLYDYLMSMSRNFLDFFDFFLKFLEHLPKCTYIRHSNYSITSPPLPLNPNIILLIKPLSIRVYTINGYILTPTYIRCR